MPDATHITPAAGARQTAPVTADAPVVAAGAWRRAAVALFTVSAGTNVPTPLLIVYRERLDLGPDVLTALFGAYALGLVPALFLAGPASDRWGRRRLVLGGTALAGLASLLLVAAASSLPLLVTGRVVQGAVSGIVFSACGAWLTELSGPGAGPAAGRRAAVAMTGGFSLGPLLTGFVAEYGPAPTTLPYLLHVALVAGGLAAVATLPETVPPRTTVPAPGLLAAAGDRRVLLGVLAPMSVWVFAFPTVVVAAVPLLVRTDAPPVLLTGVLAGLTLGTGTLAAPLQRRWGRWTAARACAAGVAGYLLVTVGAVTGSPAVLLASALVLGGSGGLMLAAGLTLTARLARPDRRGALTAVFYAFAYVGFGAPYAVAVTAAATRVEVPLLAGALLAALVTARLVVSTRRGDLGPT